MRSYDHKSIEKKWQKKWDEEGAFKAPDDPKKKKYYPLIEFPYPSGAGLHVGHPRPYIALDIIARKRRAEGFNVLYPIGWDAFGLPTENYALKTGKDPRIVTKENSDTFRRQIQSLGISFDWSREINTTDPKYYKWTQWIFLQLFKKGLAYKAETAINWCPKDKIGLANEEVVDGKCERCGTPVEQRLKEQWMLKITEYAKRLYDDLDTVDYIERAKVQQRNWIGPSEGAEIAFPIVGSSENISVFTTRADTLFGATFLVLAPEHPSISKLPIKNRDEVAAYVVAAQKKTAIERTAETKKKTGVKLKGVTAVNPANKEEIPVFIADYVLATYGTGALMAVPAHDDRDYAFAKQFDLQIREVIIPKVVDVHDPPIPGKKTVERKAVQAIVIDPKTNKVLCLKWKKFPWTTFITGGIEEEEDPIEGAKREILEETGYTNVVYKRTLGGPVESHFYANHKGENRKALFTAMVFELGSEEQNEISEAEREKHVPEWLTWAELAADKNVKCSEYDIWVDRFFNEPHPFTGKGVLINSGEFSGIESDSAKEKITHRVKGELKTTFKLRDWVFSRQRYWGEPIPMIHCGKCGWQPVSEKNLPVELPEVEKYQPTDTGESPLANITEWVNTTCPKCKGPAKRETDVMPNWAGSSWYYLRYCDPDNDAEFADSKKLKYWTPVDWYNGGMEHTVLHLLYSRFWHKFLYDEGLVPTIEPYAKRTSHGVILAEDGKKMSKSLGNVINPDDIVERFGADALRVYEMFMGPFDQAIAWSTDSLVGARRFLEKVAGLHERVSDVSLTPTLETLMHQTIKKVSEDTEVLKMNTAVSALMIFQNGMSEEKSVPKKAYKTLLQLLAPFAPHLSEELWSDLGEKSSIQSEPWLTYDPKKLQSQTLTIAIQINGKMRTTVSVPVGVSEGEIEQKARELPEVEKWLSGKTVSKIIYVPGRVMNILTSS